MKILVGLGNPGAQYEKTRHNVGYRFVDSLLKKVSPDSSFSKNERFEVEIADFQNGGEKIVLAKPITFMNLSGRAVSKIVSYYKIGPEKIWTVSDDVDLPLGSVRIRQDGSSGGHKGLQNIIDETGSKNFVRVRIGVSSLAPGEETTLVLPKVDTADFVLGRFTLREEGIITKVIEETIQYLLPFLSEDRQMPAHSFSVDEN
ncbi:MAG TPA: aminoacyl-tRNA hydrolase [bacterium]|nr:aminoacyl-tRNA hydrolase [bacterium]